MIDTFHSSVLHGILHALGPADNVRLASCSKSLYKSIMVSSCRATLIPILRERLKASCWSLLQAGYCVEVSNTPVSYISRSLCNPRIKFYFYQSWKEIFVDDKKTFGKVFDQYIIDAHARLQRSNLFHRPTIRVKKIEKHFARCAEQLLRVATDSTLRMCWDHIATTSKIDFSTRLSYGIQSTNVNPALL